MELSEFQRPLNILKIKDENKLDDILIIEEYKKIMFNELSETIKKLSIKFKNDFVIHGKRLKNNQYLILVKFIKTSVQNCINEDILFQIIIQKEFPQTSPQIYCCSNVIYFNLVLLSKYL